MAKEAVLLLGAGKIGSLVACLLAETGGYEVHVADLNLDPAEHKPLFQGLSDLHLAQLDAGDQRALDEYLHANPVGTLISALPYHCNPLVADTARHHGLHYFDLTEDVQVSAYIKTVARHANTCFAPQCGLAPGFISIATNHLMGHFDDLDTVQMRVGALPLHPNNALKYSLTWSTDGLINEYGNPCYALVKGEKVVLQALEGYETISLDGVKYEAFNTSGGLGTLVDSYTGRVHNMNYKTMRYPGHCERIRLLMNDLKLNEDRSTLKRILENAIPKTLQDVVLVYAAVTGHKNGMLFEETFVQKVYPQSIAGHRWSAIQVSTASALCAVVDLVLQEPARYRGFLTQESIPLQSLLDNRFGVWYRTQDSNGQPQGRQHIHSGHA